MCIVLWRRWRRLHLIFLLKRSSILKQVREERYNGPLDRTVIAIWLVSQIMSSQLTVPFNRERQVLNSCKLFLTAHLISLRSTPSRNFLLICLRWNNFMGLMTMKLKLLKWLQPYPRLKWSLKSLELCQVRKAHLLSIWKLKHFRVWKRRRKRAHPSDWRTKSQTRYG